MGTGTKRWELENIIENIEFWLKEHAKTPCSVGALIQRDAGDNLKLGKEVVGGGNKDMCELLVVAKSELANLLLVDQVKAHSKKVEEEMMGTMQLKGVRPLPTFPGHIFNFSFKKPKTRKEELEEMDDATLMDTYKVVQNKEIRAERIKYILEAEKGDK